MEHGMPLENLHLGGLPLLIHDDAKQHWAFDAGMARQVGIDGGHLVRHRQTGGREVMNHWPGDHLNARPRTCGGTCARMGRCTAAGLGRRARVGVGGEWAW